MTKTQYSLVRKKVKQIALHERHSIYNKIENLFSKYNNIKSDKYIYIYIWKFTNNI